MDSRQSFCLALKTARERRGITLAQIAASTKVCVSHFAALERNDVRSWPKGLFRRAFFRGYVEMIGLPVAETTDEFVRLFADDEAAAPIPRAVTKTSPLRLSLDPSWHAPRPTIAWRVAAATIDAGAITVPVAALIWLAGTHAGTTVAIVAVSYFTAATLLLGSSPAASVIRWLRARPADERETAPEAAAGVLARAWQGVTVAANVFRNATEASSSESVDAAGRIWATDARRVTPREAPPRLRVRFKLP